MKFVSAALLSIFAIFLSGDAKASPIKYSFSGALTDIRNSGAGITFGTSFHGTYIHDDSPQIGRLIEPGRQLYTGRMFGVSAANTILLGVAASELQVFDNWSSAVGGYNQDDGYFVSSRVYDRNGTDFYLIQFDLWDFTGSSLTSLEMPSQNQFSQLASNGRVWIRRFEGGTETGLAGGTFGSMDHQEIPEPNTLVLSLGSLASLVWLGRTRKSAA